MNPLLFSALGRETFVLLPLVGKAHLFCKFVLPPLLSWDQYSAAFDHSQALGKLGNKCTIVGRGMSCNTRLEPGNWGFVFIKKDEGFSPVYWGFNLGPLKLLDKCSTTWAIPPVFLLLVCFLDRA
jgi:hypothetical protein